MQNHDKGATAVGRHRIKETAQGLDAARRGGYAYPAINVTSSQTLNAALKGFADAESDGIIQISVGGAAYVSGRGVNDRVTGSLALLSYPFLVELAPSG